MDTTICMDIKTRNRHSRVLLRISKLHQVIGQGPIFPETAMSQSWQEGLCTLSSPSSFHCPGIMSSGTLAGKLRLQSFSKRISANEIKLTYRIYVL